MNSEFEHDDSELEERISSLLNDGTPVRAISAADVIHGARRRRARHRATVAGSTLAVVGVAATAVVALGGGAKSSGLATAATGTSTSPAATTCSAAVTGSTPAAGTHNDAQGLPMVTIGSGTVAGIPWDVSVHVFPNKEAYVAAEPPGLVPAQADDAIHPGRDARFERSDQAGWEMLGEPTGWDPGEFFSYSSGGLGTSVDRKSPAALFNGWVDPRVDHMCVQYQAHAEFLPVVRVEGGAFAAFAAARDDRPQKIVGYGADGKVVGTMQGRSVGEGVFDPPPVPPPTK